jgi:4-amino-4-deoxy-L-arabinose transferase-like glycosyltransferase
MNAVASALSRRRLLLLALFLALFAASQALLWFAYYADGAKTLIGDEQVYQTTALAILAGGPWMASSIWPPLQPLFIAAVYALFGTHLLAVQIAQTMLFIACAALLRDLWRRLGGSVAAANTAAALWLLNPATAAYAQWLWPELPHLFLLLATLCLLARAFSRGAAFAGGLCVGLAILAKSLLSIFWPAFLIAYLQRERPYVRLQPAAAFVLGLAVVTTPALLHGWREYGKPMIADSSIYNVWIGLTDTSRSDYVGDMGGLTLPAFLASGATPQQRNALYLDKVRTLVADRGLLRVVHDQLGRQYFRLFSAKTPLVSQLPGAACAGHLSAYRSPPWLTRTLIGANDVLHVLLLAAGAFGIACRRWRPQVPIAQGDRLLAVVVLFFAYQLALLLLIHVKARFLLPMLPFLCGFAGSFLVALRARWCAGRAEPTIALTPARIAFGAALSALLLFLAFAGPSLDHLCAG